MNRLEDFMDHLPRFVSRYKDVQERPYATYSAIRPDSPRRCTPDPYTPDNAYWLHNFGRAEADWLTPPLHVPDSLEDVVSCT